MGEALKAAKRGLGRTSPNPAVGAVVVKGSQVIGRGYHRKAGLAHAEIEAMRGLGKKDLRGATLFVTLEPCCNWGHTPPCTGAIIGSGIKKVVIGAFDPNPEVSGRGVRILRRAGVEVSTRVIESQCLEIIEWYAKYITTQRPFVILKIASTLDGRIATASGRSRWITGMESRRYVHRLRSMMDAVMVGSSTVRTDDPELSVRLVKGRRNPARVVVDRSFETPFTAKVFAGVGESGGGGGEGGKGGEGVFVFTTKKAKREKVEEARSLGATVKIIRETASGVSLKGVLRELGRAGITSLLVEGGARLSASILRERLADKVLVFLSPMVLGADSIPSVGPLGTGSLKGALRLKDVRVSRTGEDILVEGYTGGMRSKGL